MADKVNVPLNQQYMITAQDRGIQGINLYTADMQTGDMVIETPVEIPRSAVPRVIAALQEIYARQQLETVVVNNGLSLTHIQSVDPRE